LQLAIRFVGTADQLRHRIRGRQPRPPHPHRGRRIAGSGDPRRLGQPLTGDRHGFWRYRVGDYRIVAAIEDDRLVVLVVTVGHRREVYR
jgi:mRNA-degrading endonuclease RelE of RelBE toxin-antitoxin system